MYGETVNTVQSSAIVWYTHKYSHSWIAHGISRLPITTGTL